MKAGLEEDVNWGHPCYRHAGRNIVIIGAFRGDFRLTFFNAGLMSDPDGVMKRQGPNTQAAGMMRFTDNVQAIKRRGVILAYLAEVMGYARAGIRAVREGVRLICRRSWWIRWTAILICLKRLQR